MAKKTKKDLISTPDPSQRGKALVHRLNANQVDGTVCTVSQMMARWRYIDFVNPNAKLPSVALEWLFGARGLLAGRMIQFRAKYSKGKSSFMYLMYASAQLLSKAWCFHVESEGAMAPADYVASFGADPDDLAIDEIQTFETCLERVDEVIAQIRGGFGGGKTADGRPKKTVYTDPLDPNMESPILVGIDSLSSLGLADYAELDIADVHGTPALALHARKLRQYLRDRMGRFNQTQTLLMLTSHETSKIKTGRSFGGGGDTKSALAQEAIGIHATYVVDVDAVPWVDKEKSLRIGDIITLTTEKNKLSPRGRQLRLYLRWGSGFDLVKTDAEFLISSNYSPFTKEQLYRHSAGITCKALSKKSIKSDEDFVRLLYDNQDVIMGIREEMRIRGCGFEFEAKYMPTPEEVEDNKNSEESDIDGVEGSGAKVPEG